jgi:Antitoxin VbhA
MAMTSKADRRQAVTRTLASWRIEGFEPHAEYMALLERFVEGEITLAHVRAETQRTVNLQTKTVA